MNCYVLTGGSSSRMGTPKALLELEGKSFLDRVVDAASPVFDQVIAVTRTGEPAPTNRVPVIHEAPHPGTSAIFGVLRALEDSEGRAWIVAVDYPLLTSGILRFLRERFEQTPAQVLVPVWDGHPQLLCAGYTAEVSGILGAMAASGRRRLRGLLDEIDAEMVQEEELRARFPGEPLSNINLPAEYENLRKAHERR